MNKENASKLWKMIQEAGDYLVGQLPDHPNHPKGRNSYAHVAICVKDHFKASYKDIPDEKFEEVVKYIEFLKQNLQVWEHTAGWFEDQTGLNNSTLILPDQVNEGSYKIINHCRWDHLIDILPSLIFKKSFKDFVLNNFEANNVAAMPILYRLA